MKSQPLPQTAAHPQTADTDRPPAEHKTREHCGAQVQSERNITTRLILWKLERKNKSPDCHLNATFRQKQTEFSFSFGHNMQQSGPDFTPKVRSLVCTTPTCNEQHLKPSLLHTLCQLPFNKTFPLVCFALLTFFSLFSSVSSTPWAECQLQRLKLLPAPYYSPPPSTNSNKPNSRNETLLIQEQRDWRKEKDGGRSKKKHSCQI